MNRISLVLRRIPWVVALLAWVLTCPSRGEQVVFSEILYYPRGEQPEYLEIYNNTATPFDIAGWRLTEGVAYEFPLFNPANPGVSFLKPFERIVLSGAEEGMVRAAYDIPASVRVFGPWSGSLSNDRERITLADKNGVIVCTVDYNDGGLWSLAADGAGHSLLLKSPNRSVNDGRNWTGSPRPGGTPGTAPVLAAETPVASPEVDLSQGITVVDFGDVWKFQDQALDLGGTWMTPGYNDAGWPQGAGLFGFENSALPSPGIRTPFQNAGQLTYYLRQQFVYNGRVQGAALFVDQVLDDGAIYYLNGVELGRSGMADGVSGFTVRASRTVGDAALEEDAFSASASALVAGVNTLAVEVHQINPTSSDLVFGMRLRVAVPAVSQSGVVLNEVLPAGPGKGFVEFYNPGNAPVDLNGFFLSDSAANLRKFRISTPLLVPAQGFASIGFAEASLTAGDPTAVYLVAPDGVAVEHGIRASVPQDGRSLGQKPAGSGAWFLFSTPTREGANRSQENLGGVVRLNEVHWNSAQTVDWVELFNASDSAASLEGLFLSSRRDFSDRVALSGTVNARGFASQGTSFTLDGSTLTLYLVDAEDAVLDARAVTRVPGRESVQAFPDGTTDWFSAPGQTRNASNNPSRPTDIVINEIMFYPPSDELEGEFIELFNRGDREVDLSGWRFSRGPNFTIPEGTRIRPGGYVVCAASAAKVRSVYGDVLVVGDFQGRLANRGEPIELVDQFGNPADRVDYSFGGDWPEWAHGGGSSLELVNPWLDNSAPSAWRDSDESGKAAFKTYSVTDTYRQANSIGGAADYRELHFFLANDGYAVLRNVSLRQDGSGPNLVVNGTVQSTTGSGAAGWLCQGTHAASFVDNGQLHLIADGHGDNRANRAEIDVPGLVANTSLTLSFEARWVHGSPRLIGQTWDHTVGFPFRLSIPENLGTPGAVNSCYQAAPPPQVEGLAHAPAVPRSNQEVKVTVRVLSPSGVSSVQLFHRADSSSGNAAWSSKTMFDDGVQGGDVLAGDGTYTATLTEHQVNGRIVQFYARVTAGNGASFQRPTWGAERPAMYVVDDRTIPRDLRAARFIISAFDLDAIASGATARHQYRYPRLSNHYKNMTFISNEEEVHYNGFIRNSGSPWTRGGDLSRGKWKLPEDRKFRGHVKFTFDNDPTAGRMHHNRISRYMLYLLGHPVNENEFIRVIINSQNPSLREDTEPVAKDMMDRLFENGREGELYRIDDEWWFTDSWDRRDRNADWSYKNSENPVRYQTEWMKRTAEDDYDYSALINLFRTISTTPYTQAQIERLVDAEATLMMAAVRGYIGDWDSFTLNRGKNGYMYRRWHDGKFMFLHWDSDLAFQNSGETLYNAGRPGIGPYISKPYNLRRFYYYLTELLDRYTLNSPRMNAWLQAEEEASNAFTVAASFYRNWFSSRLNICRQRMGNNYTREFAVATNDGQPLTTSERTLTLRGSAPYTVFAVDVANHPEAAVEWESLDGWVVRDIALRAGANPLLVRGLDQWGNVLHQVPLTVQKNGSGAPPVVALSADPKSWNVPVEGALQLEARDSYDPEGTPLTYRWTPPPHLAGFDTNQPGRAAAAFARPGLYTFALEATDADGQSAALSRDAAVYGPGGFSSFLDVRLEPHWSLQSVQPRQNDPGSAWLSLSDVPGWLTVQVLDDRAWPGSGPAPLFPRISRPLPAAGDWVLQTRLRLLSRQFGDYQSGLQVEAISSRGTDRYLFGIANGTEISAVKVEAAGGVTSLGSVPNDGEEVALRVRRVQDQLFFDRQAGDAWMRVASGVLAASSTTPQGGLFLATSVPQSVRVTFDYAMLVDPAQVSPLHESLRVSEIMFQPVGGEEFEFIELVNTGSQPIDLTGVQFTAGISFTFGAAVLPPGERIVVVSDRAAFAARYGTGRNLAAGVYTGRLSNEGELITLADRAGVVIHSFTYGVSGDWPERAGGAGSSLEIIDSSGDYDDPDNWAASSEYLGSPGRAGQGPLTSVVINEVISNTSAPLEDAMELFNPTAGPVDMSGWFLSDAAGDLRKFRIPAGTILPPGGYKVFFASQFNDSSNPAITPFGLASWEGDDVWLTAADVAGALTFFIDHVKFGASEEGVSFGRHPNGSGPWVALSARTFGVDNPASLDEFRQSQGAANAYPKVGPVVFRRIMYHPADGADEFLELENISAASVLLSDPAFPTNTWRLSNGVDYTFPAGTELRPGERILVSPVAPDVFRLRNSTPADVRVFGPYGGALNNAGEALELSRPGPPQTPAPPDLPFVPYLVVERVRYDNRAPWPTLADGFGAALQRRVAANFGNDPANWFTDLDRDGMADDWEIAHGLDPFSASDAALDPDGDGRINLEEYESGTDPRQPEGSLELLSPRVTGNTFTFEFHAGANQTFTVYYSETVHGQTWLKLTDVPAEALARRVSVTDDISSGSARFYRVVRPQAP